MRALLPLLEDRCAVDFILYENGIQLEENQRNGFQREKTIHVLINKCTEDDELQITYQALTSDPLELLMSIGHFKNGLIFQHNHIVDNGSVEILPFGLDNENGQLDCYSLLNSCDLFEEQFSPCHTSMRIKKNLSIKAQKHSTILEIMQLKDICRVSENYNYLNTKLPENFFREFLCQFYRIFKDKNIQQGFKNFVFGEFKNLVEAYLNPGSYYQKVSMKNSFKEIT